MNPEIHLIQRRKIQQSLSFAIQSHHSTAGYCREIWITSSLQLEDQPWSSCISEPSGPGQIHLTNLTPKSYVWISPMVAKLALQEDADNRLCLMLQWERAQARLNCNQSSGIPIKFKFMVYTQYIPGIRTSGTYLRYISGIYTWDMNQKVYTWYTWYIPGLGFCV